MKIKVGNVLKAQGIKGEVKARCLLDNAEMLKTVKTLFLDGTAYEVAQIRFDGEFFFVKFVGVGDRNAAEELKNSEIFCEKEDISLPDGRYFVDDILGCRVVLDDGTEVGKVVDVLQYGAADVYVCSDGKKLISFPVLKDLLCSVNVESSRIVLSAKRFGEVAVYDED